MSFVITGLGPEDQKFVLQLSPMILNTLHTAASTIQRGGGTKESTGWFSDSSKPWMTQLASDLSHFASIFNLEKISIGFRPLARRKGSYAAAQMPEDGWGKYTQLSKARGQGFTVMLDTMWNQTPLIRTAGGQDSMFQTLVHELTHLVIGTEDEQYSFDPCLELAKRAPAKAKINADSWGYFVEDFR